MGTPYDCTSAIEITLKTADKINSHKIINKMQTSQNDVHTSSDKLDPYSSGFLHYSEGTLKNMGPVYHATDMT